MKKFIIELLKFTVFASIFYVLLLLLWGTIKYPFFKPNLFSDKGSYGHTFTRLNDAKTFKEVDILILGSSHAYRGFDNRIFNKNNISTFNLGTSAQTPAQTLMLLKRYLNKISPKMVILEVYPGILNSDGVESSLDIIKNDTNDFLSVEMALKQNNIKVYNTLIYSMYKDFFRLDKNFVEKRINNDDTYVDGGFVERKITNYKPRIINKQSIIINKSQLKAFEEVIQEIKKHNIELILVSAPITKDIYNSYTNNDYFDSLMTSYSRYYNFNTIIRLNDSLDFYDSNHLNQNGVEKFNTKLIELLKKNHFKSK